MNVGRLTVPRNPLITEVDSVRSGMDLSGTTRWRRGAEDRGWNQDWRRCSEGQPRIAVQQIRMEPHLRARARSSPLRLDRRRTSTCKARYRAWPCDDVRDAFRAKWIAPRPVLTASRQRTNTRASAFFINRGVIAFRTTRTGRDDGTQPDRRASSVRDRNPLSS